MTAERHKTVEVFTPTKPAHLAFVDRKQIHDQLRQACWTPGKQIVIYGHSGCGKTTLISNTLFQLGRNAVTTRCTKDSSFASIVLSAFDKLNPYYSAEQTQKRTETAKASLEANYQLVKASLASELASEAAQKSVRALPPQLTAERLAEFCGAAECCWVIEDFHKVPIEEKSKLAQSMKVFMDTAAEYQNVKIIAIGAVDTARDVVQYDPEMRNRVSEVAVPLLTTAELKEILTKGEQLLNVRFGALKDEIATYSSGLGAVCHQLALNICMTAGLMETSPQEVWIQKEQLQDALAAYVRDSSDTLKTAFDKAIKRKRERTFDNTNLILKALTQAGASGATHAELLKLIQQAEASYPASNLTYYLRELETQDRGEILRHDGVSGRYYFNDPLYLVYAQCLYVPAKGSKKIEMTLLGVSFTVDLEEFEKLRLAAEQPEVEAIS